MAIITAGMNPSGRMLVTYYRSLIFEEASKNGSSSSRETERRRKVNSKTEEITRKHTLYV
jgi:hypothetical protein